MCRKKLEGSWDMEEKFFKKKVEFPNTNLTFLNEDERRIFVETQKCEWAEITFLSHNQIKMSTCWRSVAADKLFPLHAFQKIY